MHELQPGTILICVDGDFCVLLAQAPPGMMVPLEGVIYTVRDVMLTMNGVGITLVGLNNKHLAPAHPEVNFAIHRFRFPDEALPLYMDESIEAATYTTV